MLRLGLVPKLGHSSAFNLTSAPPNARFIAFYLQAMTNPDQPAAKQRAFSYTEMMNSGQQQLSAEQIAALEKQAKKRSDESKNPPTTKP